MFSILHAPGLIRLTITGSFIMILIIKKRTQANSIKMKNFRKFILTKIFIFLKTLFYLMSNNIKNFKSSNKAHLLQEFSGLNLATW